MKIQSSSGTKEWGVGAVRGRDFGGRGSRTPRKLSLSRGAACPGQPAVGNGRAVELISNLPCGAT